MRALRISNNPIIYVPALYSTGMFWYDPGVRYVTFLWVSTESLSVAPLWSSHRIYRLADDHQPPVTGRSLTLHMYCIFRPNQSFAIFISTARRGNILSGCQGSSLRPQGLRVPGCAPARPLCEEPDIYQKPAPISPLASVLETSCI